MNPEMKMIFCGMYDTISISSSRMGRVLNSAFAATERNWLRMVMFLREHN